MPTVPRQIESESGPRRLTVRMTAIDEMRHITFLAIVGLLIVAAMRISGRIPIGVPMPTHAVGWVEPTCGITRGSISILRGDFALAFRFNPLSFLVIAFGIAGSIRAIVGWTTHRWLDIRVRMSKMIWALLGIAVVAFWLYQQTRADFIINARI